jgi:cyclic-di-GMP-binding protein
MAFRRKWLAVLLPPARRCLSIIVHPSNAHRIMAQTASFDVTTGVDLQEVDNAINQAQKEVSQRYDFKGSKATIEFKRGESLILLVADSEFQMTALFDIVQTKLIKRGVPVKNLDIGEIKNAGGDTVRREVKLKMSLDADTAKKVSAAIKDAKLKKVQASIQGEQVRVSGPSRDDLQEAITLLRGMDFGVQLQFGNYR